MELGFPQGDSIIHRLDPRARIVAAVAFSTIVATADKFPVLLSSLGLGVVFVGLARLRLSRLLWHLSAVNLFILMLWLVLPIATPGQTIGRVGPLHVTREGLLQAFAITLKSNAIVLTCIALLSTMDAVRLGHALHRLGLPDKLVHVLLFTVRHFEILHREYHRLRAAMKVRGFRPATNRHTYRTYGYLVGMLLVNSFDRSERVLAAMKCRGFKGRFHVLDHFTFNRRDWAFSGAAGAILLLMGYVQWARTLL